MKRALLILAVILLLSGCGSAAQQETAAPVSTPEPTQTAAPTATPTPDPVEIIEYPSGVSDEYKSRAVSPPKAMLTTPASENHLNGTICVLRGTVKEYGTQEAEAPINYFILNDGEYDICVLDIYGFTKEFDPARFPLVEESDVDYTFPPVSSEAVVYTVYTGYSEKMKMPAFDYGVTKIDAIEYELADIDSVVNFDKYEDSMSANTPEPEPTPEPKEEPAEEPLSLEQLHEFFDLQLGEMKNVISYTITDEAVSVFETADSFYKSVCDSVLRESAYKSYQDLQSSSMKFASSIAEKYKENGYNIDVAVNWVSDLENEKIVYTASDSEITFDLVADERENMTFGKQNALKTAKQYLSNFAFSYTGLIEQLEYEEYSHEESVFGADFCGADWYEQASLSAKSYLNNFSFSKSGLISQLEYEGFTHEQAVYGAEENGY